MHTLYERLGGYDAINAVSRSLVTKLRAHPKLGRFWAHRGDDGIERELQLLVDYMCHKAGGPLYYTGRDMLTTHKGMGIDDADWTALLANLDITLEEFSVPDAERHDVVGFIQSLKADIVEA